MTRNLDLHGKRIFLSGGAGFIGSALAERLVADNELVVFDTFQRNAIQSRSFSGHPNLTLVTGDVLDAAAVERAMAGCNIVVHLAAIAGIDTVITSPTRTMRVNMLGSANVLAAAAALPACERVLCFSTSEVFGTHAFRSDETDQTVMGAVGEARWTYAVSKLAEEHLAHAYHKEFGLPTVVVRPFNIYGPGQVGEGAIHAFVKRAVRDEDLEIHGDGTQIRAWCYVDDMVDGLMLCLTRQEAVGESFNIGNNRAVVTVFGLASTVVRVLGSRSAIRFTRRDYVDVELRVPKVDKAIRLLGFEAKVDLEEGLRLTADWYRQGPAPASVA
jgi:UDP-glucose 4-epimerase